jgi:hypothetical protein
VVTVSGATYDANPHGGTAKVTGVAGLDQSLTVSYTGVNGTVYPTSTTAPTAAGDYTASAIYVTTNNYQGSSDTKPFTIAKRSISVQPVVTNAAQLIWTGSPLTPTYALSAINGTSLAGSEQMSVLGIPTITPFTVTPVGPFTITIISGLSNPNYDITPVTGQGVVLDQSKPTGTITELLPIPLGGTPILKVNFNDVTSGNSNIVSWQYRLDNAPYGATTIPVSPQSPNANVQANVVVPTNATDVVQVCVQGQDAGGNWSPEVCALLAIYDPTAGFVTGGGWIDSPAGAYAPDPKLAGKANFGFVSKYLKGATVPTGNTEFQFKEGNLNFKSTNFQWLVIQGTSMSQFKGTGTINGTGSYNFLVTANDGDVGGVKKPDSFRIKITQGTDVIYDNKMLSPETAADATVLGGGSIQIQSK